MPAKFDELNKAVEDTTAQATAMETVAASVVEFVNGQHAATEAAVVKALEADNAADQGSIDTVRTAMEGVRSRFAASAQKIADALVANTPPPPPPPVG